MPMSDKGKRAAAAAIVAAGASLGLAETAAAATVPATLAVNQACYVTVGKARPRMVVTGNPQTTTSVMKDSHRPRTRGGTNSVRVE